MFKFLENNGINNNWFTLSCTFMEYALVTYVINKESGSRPLQRELSRIHFPKALRFKKNSLSYYSNENWSFRLSVILIHTEFER